MPDTASFWQKLPKQGWVRLITTASKISDDLILNVAHDISSTEDSLLWLHSTIFQKLPVLISDDQGCCIAATEGAAQLCGVAQTESLLGKTIADTSFAHMFQRERDLVEQSRVEGRPVHSIEWAVDAAGQLNQYVVTRIALSGANWLLILQEITGETPYLTHPPEILREASNVEPKLTRQQFAVLQGLWHGERREDTAERLDIKSATVDDYRKQLKRVLGVAETRDIISSIRGEHIVLAKVLDSLSLRH
jgi:DNA-binding CsgD family transcriptional regulator